MNEHHNLLSGTKLAKDLLASTRSLWMQCPQPSPTPVLAIIQVGHLDASSIYIQHKIAACDSVGFGTKLYHFETSVTQSELLNQLTELNNNADIHGILIQLPLPQHLDPAALMAHVDPMKDVDAIGPTRLGQLLSGRCSLLPCTTAAILNLLDAYSVKLSGRQVVMVGHSFLVGKPTVAALLQEHATVTVCHAYTRDLAKHIQEAEIVIVAIGNPNVVKIDWLKKDTIVIDVGINRSQCGKIIGDVDTKAALAKGAFVSPVPGGVGPLTVACLVQNLFKLYCQQRPLP